jgi:hypothetical protein
MQLTDPVGLDRVFAPGNPLPAVDLLAARHRLAALRIDWSPGAHP